MARNWLIVCAAAALFTANNAWAQPTEEEEDEAAAAAADLDAPTEPGAEETAVDPAPPVAEPPERVRKRAPARRRAATVPSLRAAPVDDRPDGFTIGIGIGYIMPADIDAPDAASVRFRLGSGLTFEPRLELETAALKTDVGSTETQDAVNTIRLVTTVRFPFRSRRAVDFIFVGGLLAERVVQDPDGGDNNQTDTGIALTWGLSIDYWITQHWCFSFTALNPFVSHTSTVQEIAGADDSKQSVTAFGAIFDPTVIAMMHLFY